MLKDDKVRRLATEFACQWLHVYDFDTLDEKSERHFPTFAGLRGAMYEETIRFFTDLFQRDLPVLAFLDADHTFLNEPLAEHYGIPGVSGEEWRRVEGMKAFGRGGILGLSTTLAKQSGASRTSPILRGNWVSEVLLGEKLPRPPTGVPQLPDDEASAGGLTRAPARRAAHARPEVRHLPRQDRPARLRPRRLRRDRPQAREGPGRPPGRRQREAPGRHHVSTASTAFARTC